MFIYFCPYHIHILGAKKLVICKLYGPHSSFWLNYSTTANEFINPKSIQLPAYTASKCTLQIFLHNGTIIIALYSFVYWHIFCSHYSDENIVAHAFYLVSSLYVRLLTSNYCFILIHIIVGFVITYWCNNPCRLDENDLKYLFFE